MSSQRKNKNAVQMVSYILLIMCLLFGTAIAANAQGESTTKEAEEEEVDDSLEVNGPGDVRMYRYFARFPAAAVFGPKCPENTRGHDVIKKRKSVGPGTVTHSLSGAVYAWPVHIPTCTSAVPTLRDEAIQEHLLKTYGLPISDTQFQMIHRWNQQILLEQMFDPEKVMWMGATLGSTQLQDSANASANVVRNQCASAIDFVGCSIYNFTVDDNNKWNKIRNQLFLPMAILLLLPGAVLAQLRVIVAAGMPIGGSDVSPFEGITRSIVCIFLIPATYLVVNYGVDVNNSITYTIADEYKRIFGSNMYKDALCTVVRAFPVRQSHENNNGFQKKSERWGLEHDGTAAAKFEGDLLRNKSEDPCSGKFETPPERADEMAPFTNVGQHFISNASNAALSAAWNILCAFQLVFFLYLWMVGPVVAALWVYPSQQLRGALPSWVEGVVTLSFWGFFWNVVVLLFACFKGVDDTGTIITSALMFLATAAVKYAFDFAGLIKEAGSAAAGHAMGAAQKVSQSAGPRGGQGTTPSGSQRGTGSDGPVAPPQTQLGATDGTMALGADGGAGTFNSGTSTPLAGSGSLSLGSSGSGSSGSGSGSGGGAFGGSGSGSGSGSGDASGRTNLANDATNAALNPPLTDPNQAGNGNANGTGNADQIGSANLPPMYGGAQALSSLNNNNTLNAGSNVNNGGAGSTLNQFALNNNNNNAYNLGGISANNPALAGQNLAAGGMNHMERLNSLFNQAQKDVATANLSDPQGSAQRNAMLAALQNELYTSDGTGQGQLTSEGASALNGLASNAGLNSVAANQYETGNNFASSINTVMNSISGPNGASPAAINNAQQCSQTMNQFAQQASQGLMTQNQLQGYQSQLNNYAQTAQQLMQAGPAAGPLVDASQAQAALANTQQQLQGLAPQYQSSQSYYTAPPVDGTGNVMPTSASSYVAPNGNASYVQPNGQTFAQPQPTVQSFAQPQPNVQAYNQAPIQAVDQTGAQVYGQSQTTQTTQVYGQPNLQGYEQPPMQGYQQPTVQAYSQPPALSSSQASQPQYAQAPDSYSAPSLYSSASGYVNPANAVYSDPGYVAPPAGGYSYSAPAPTPTSGAPLPGPEPQVTAYGQPTSNYGQPAPTYGQPTPTGYVSSGAPVPGPSNAGEYHAPTGPQPQTAYVQPTQYGQPTAHSAAPFEQVGYTTQHFAQPQEGMGYHQPTAHTNGGESVYNAYVLPDNQRGADNVYLAPTNNPYTHHQTQPTGYTSQAPQPNNNNIYTNAAAGSIIGGLFGGKVVQRNQHPQPSQQQRYTTQASRGTPVQPQPGRVNQPPQMASSTPIQRMKEGAMQFFKRPTRTPKKKNPEDETLPPPPSDYV